MGRRPIQSNCNIGPGDNRLTNLSCEQHGVNHCNYPKLFVVLNRMPRDCTEFPIRLVIDAQSPGHRVSHTMTNKTKQNKQKKEKNVKIVVNKPTPFATAGSIIGGGAAAMAGYPAFLGAGLGHLAGSAIGSIFGSGDYTMVGPKPSYNTVVNASQIPKFLSKKMTNIICHREFLGDIKGTVDFTNRVYPINPGSEKTFPWLSSLAGSYQEYKIHGLVFEFRSMVTDYVTNGAPGTIMMATNYNADAPPFVNKPEMENSEFTVSAKPTLNLMHGVECADKMNVLGHRYVRVGSLGSGQDLKFTDLGNFQFATKDNPVQTLGELWVTYCIEFFKPIMPTDIGGDVLSVAIQRNTSINSTNVLGLIQVSKKGDLESNSTSSDVSWIGHTGNYYQISVFWDGTSTVFTHPSVTFIGCTLSTLAPQPYVSPTTGTATTAAIYQAVVVATGDLGGECIVRFTGGALYPNNNVYIRVTQWSSEAV